MGPRGQSTKEGSEPSAAPHQEFSELLRLKLVGLQNGCGAFQGGVGHPRPCGPYGASEVFLEFLLGLLLEPCFTKSLLAVPLPLGNRPPKGFSVLINNPFLDDGSLEAFAHSVRVAFAFLQGDLERLGLYRITGNPALRLATLTHREVLRS